MGEGGRRLRVFISASPRSMHSTRRALQRRPLATRAPTWIRGTSWPGLRRVVAPLRWV